MIARRQDALSPERDDAAIILHGRALCGTQPLATGEAMDLAQVCKEIEVSVNIYSECCREAGDEPQPITHLAIDLDAEGEADETMITIRVVPDGREGDRVFGRSLADDEGRFRAGDLASPGRSTGPSSGDY